MSVDLSKIIDVALGLVLVYLVLSIVVTAITESIAAAFKLRAGVLRTALGWLLRTELKAGSGAVPNQGNYAGLADQVLAHPLVNNLAQGSDTPSAIPSRVFAISLLDVLHGAQAGAAAVAKPPTDPAFTFADAQDLVSKLPDGELKKSLTLVLADAQRRAIAAEDAIAAWYDQMMDRVGGWYKRKVHVINLTAGFVLAAAVNASTIHIVEDLWRDDVARQVAVTTAQQTITGPMAGSLCGKADAVATTGGQAQTDAAAAVIQCQTQAAISAYTSVGSLPLGWSQGAPTDARDWVTLVLGWIITGFALSLGAPFWFDLLQKVVKIRTSITGTTTSQPQGGTLPTPVALPALALAPCGPAAAPCPPAAPVAAADGAPLPDAQPAPCAPQPVQQQQQG